MVNYFKIIGYSLLSLSLIFFASYILIDLYISGAYDENIFVFLLMSTVAIVLDSIIGVFILYFLNKIEGELKQ